LTASREKINSEGESWFSIKGLYSAFREGELDFVAGQWSDSEGRSGISGGKGDLVREKSHLLGGQEGKRNDRPEKEKNGWKKIVENQTINGNWDRRIWQHIEGLLFELKKRWSARDREKKEEKREIAEQTHRYKRGEAFSRVRQFEVGQARWGQRATGSCQKDREGGKSKA